TVGPVRTAPSTGLLDERAHSFYVLSLYGAAKLPVIRPFLAYASAGGGGPRLSQAGTAWLALALWQAGSPADAQVLVNGLTKMPLETQDASTMAPLLEAMLTIKAPANGLKTQGANGDLTTSQSSPSGPATGLQAYA